MRFLLRSHHLRSWTELAYLSGVRCRCLAAISNSVATAWWHGIGRPQVGFPLWRGMTGKRLQRHIILLGAAQWYSCLQNSCPKAALNKTASSASFVGWQAAMIFAHCGT